MKTKANEVKEATKKTWHCTKCGSEDVEAMAYYMPNTDEVKDFSTDPEDTYCFTCNGRHGIELK